MQNKMAKKSNPVYSRNVVEFVAVANEFCKYAERAAEVKGDDLLRILQRILPLMYIKASLLPSFEPYFEDGNEKFVTETDWNRINDTLKKKFGNADDFLELFDEKFNESEIPVPSSLAENMADIYQDLKDFLLLYQTGTEEVMNDAIWECKMNFENIWGQKLVNSMKAIHRFIYSGEEIDLTEKEEKENNDRRNTSEWFISKRQKEFRNNKE
ncbi:MAG: hypothetical protein BWX96_00039 [Bacteroidetes bacterium ADurb.Bin145]|jgi:hypothetical protein|nr:MAG: hypothetical protein BWX96_00039 [Bacteroidetes bacterium ADurb.Bin145]